MADHWDPLPEPLSLGGGAGVQGFPGVAWLSESDAAQLAGAIGQLEPEIAPFAAGPEFGRLADRLRAELVRAPAGVVLGVGVGVGVDKEVVLDLVAELLVLAEILNAMSRHAAAFSLEGIAGRLIERLIAT